MHLAPSSANLDVLRRRLAPGQSERGGEITLVAALTPEASAWPTRACEVELKLPGRFALDAALRGALKTAPGVLYLEDV